MQLPDTVIDPSRRHAPPRQSPAILVVDDEPDIRNLIQEILEDEGYSVNIAENGSSARQILHDFQPDLILLDIWMPDVDGITLLKEWAETGELLMPVIMMSGHGTVETAVEATRLGAFDFIEKPLSLTRLLLVIEHALKHGKQRELADANKAALSVSEPVGKSFTMQQLRQQVRRLAGHEAPVLMSGESGTGMHLIAHYLHLCSPRKEGPFVEINVASLDDEQAAREIFGFEEGDQHHPGLLEQAAGGTAFFSDISELDMTTQARLFSALESKKFYRVNGEQGLPLNARILAASHQSLARKVAAEQFRKDLYYQLNVLPLYVPPLRDHREDVPELLNYYVTIFVEQEKLPYRKFSMAAQNRLRNYSWPGNVRELMNLVQRLLITGTSLEISLEEVELSLGSQQMPAPETPGLPLGYDLPLREARELFERAYLEYQLRRHNGSVGKVAQIAGLERTHLYRKLRSLGIDPKAIAHE
ncbi:MAG: sigma-54 dependent transcriptional regulator [Gammaproteobacteria bacterium]|nr:sigma-54 dependent transcriptional regulator [Gammaproteobacteria bacterium]MDH5650471.1 sigma-54 dependent transcriptional regulator [Gammaproteobacteria bacterium]